MHIQAEGHTQIGDTTYDMICKQFQNLVGMTWKAWNKLHSE